MKKLLALTLALFIYAPLNLKAAVQEITTLKDYETKIAKKGLVVTKFYAPYCGPCKALAPAFKDLSEAFTQVSFLEVDVEHDDIADKEDIMSMPTVIIYKDGKRVKKIVGPKKAQLNKEIEQLLKK